MKYTSNETGSSNSSAKKSQTFHTKDKLQHKRTREYPITKSKSVTHTSPGMFPKTEKTAQSKESLTHPTKISSARKFGQNQGGGISLTKLCKKEAFYLPKSDQKCQICEKCLMDCSISTIGEFDDFYEMFEWFNDEILDERTDKVSEEICSNAMSKSMKSEIVEPNGLISTPKFEKMLLLNEKAAYTATATSKKKYTFTKPRSLKIRQGTRLRSTEHKTENGLELDLNLRKSNLAYNKVNSSCNRSKRKSEFITDKMKPLKSISRPNLNYSTNKLTLVDLSWLDNRPFSISQTPGYANLKKSKANEHISSAQTSSAESEILITELREMQRIKFKEIASNQFIGKDLQGDNPEIATGFHSCKQNSPYFEDSKTVRWKKLSDFLGESLHNALRPVNHALSTDKKSNLDPADCQSKRGRRSRSAVLNDMAVLKNVTLNKIIEPNICDTETFDMSNVTNSSILLKCFVKHPPNKPPENNNGTLMPDFERMDTPTRNKELEKYGLTTLKKRRGMYLVC